MTSQNTDRDSLEREVVALRQRVSELQRRIARYSDQASVERISGFDVSVSEREELLVEAERIAHVGSWIWNMDSGEVFWSDELFRILGYDPASDRASTEAFFAALHPEDRPRVQETSARNVARGIGEQVDFRVLRADGTVRHVTMDGAFLFDENGKLRRTVGTVLDVTEQRRLQERLVQAEKMEAIGRLAGGVAHDFNNLLMVIGGDIEMLDPDQKARLQQSQKALQSARSLTARLLAFGRRSMLQKRVVDLNPLLTSTLRLLRRAVREDIRIEVTLDPAQPRVLADAALLEQALINLILNAQDAMPGPGEIHIATRLLLDDGGMVAEVNVRDTGQGMDAETLVHIFEPFFTTKSEGRGTGLGLAMVHGTVEQQGGTITVESSPGQGSTFTLRFRATRDPGEDEPRPSVTVSATDSAKTILVIDDNPAVRSMVARMLEADHHEVLLASDAAAALSLAGNEARRIDLVVCDVVMPDLRGPELVARIRGVSSRALPVIYMSGYPAGEGDLATGQGFLQKPFTMTELRSAFAAALDQTTAT